MHRMQNQGTLPTGVNVVHVEILQQHSIHNRNIQFKGYCETATEHLQTLAVDHPCDLCAFRSKRRYGAPVFWCGTKSQAIHSIFGTDRKEISRSCAADRVNSVGAAPYKSDNSVREKYKPHGMTAQGLSQILTQGYQSDELQRALHPAAGKESKPNCLRCKPVHSMEFSEGKVRILNMTAA